MTGQSVTITLTDEIDISRGDVISAATSPPGVADQFECHLVWMAEEGMLPGPPVPDEDRRPHGHGHRRPAQVQDQRQHPRAHRGQDPRAQRDRRLQRQPRPARCRSTPTTRTATWAGFILIDRFTNATVAAGLLHFALRRADNVHWQAVEVDKTARSVINGQQPAVVWFTGLSGAGKSTIANIVEQKLHELGRHTYLLDGDNVRHGLNHDLGFTDADRVENIRRVAEVAKLMVDAGLIVLVSFISPFRSERRMARDLLEPGEFIEVFVDSGLEVAEARDRKGLYAKARAGRARQLHRHRLALRGAGEPGDPPRRRRARSPRPTAPTRSSSTSVRPASSCRPLRTPTTSDGQPSAAARPDHRSGRRRPVRAQTAAPAATATSAVSPSSTARKAASPSSIVPRGAPTATTVELATP